MEPTPTHNNLPLRPGTFTTLPEALDYAAQGVTGANFYDSRGRLKTPLPYAQLREQAKGLARRLLSLNLKRGSHIALVADTDPAFLTFFFGCQYAGLVPVPLTASVNLGGRDAYVSQLRALLEASEAVVAIAPGGFLDFLEAASVGLGLRFVGTPEDFGELPESEQALRPSEPQETAYIQFTSGSTRFPRGVMITQSAVLSNLAGIIQHGVKIGAEDRCLSWLPFYHDMGLVGLVLVPVASQVSVDYLNTRDFALRPRQWLYLMDRSRATISFSPPFGYELCARRLRPGEAEKLDLSAWRVAGIGAEMIRADTLARFAQALQPGSFDKRAFLACYGMAECSLAISFAPLGKELSVDCVDRDHHAEHRQAIPATDTSSARCFVDCGEPLPGYQLEVRDSRGNPLPDRRTGTIFVKGPSVMSGYYHSPEITAETLSPEGWLNTGDVGYRIGERLIVTGREKDLIIINGRNIWPQDLEYLAEYQPEIRMGDALAFSVPALNGGELAVIVVQCRESDEARRASIVERLTGQLRSEFAIDCYVKLVPLHTLPRTSSGKLSRSAARKDFLASRDWAELSQPAPLSA